MSLGESTNVLANAVGRNDRISVRMSLTEALSVVFTTAARVQLSVSTLNVG